MKKVAKAMGKYFANPDDAIAVLKLGCNNWIVFVREISTFMPIFPSVAAT